MLGRVQLWWKQQALPSLHSQILLNVVHVTEHIALWSREEGQGWHWGVSVEVGAGTPDTVIVN